MTRVRRRQFLAVLAVFAPSAVGACRKESRCKNCGMRIDLASAWRAELVNADGSATSFDSPRCAMQWWRSGRAQVSSIRVQDYYDRQMRDGNDVRFVTGGDLLGPMGPDLVPVDPSRVPKFIQDHAANRAFRLEEITLAVLASVGEK